MPNDFLRHPLIAAHQAVEAATPAGQLLSRIAASTSRSPLTPLAERPAPVPVLSPDRRPLVSVVVPSYNYARFLPQTLDSVLSQTGVEIELIVVEDCSPDDSMAVCQRYVEADSRVTALFNERNLGKIPTLNRGLAIATGEFLVCLDSDDMLTPGSVARAVAVLDAYPNVGFVYGRPQHFEDPFVPEPNTTAPTSWTVWSGRDWLTLRCATGDNCITCPESVIRMSTMREAGKANEGSSFCADMQMWLSLAARSDVARINGPDQALHREHPLSMSVAVYSTALEYMTERRAMFNTLFDDLGPAYPGGNDLRALAMSAIARESLGRAVRAYEKDLRSPAVDRYVEFALETDPGCPRLPEWRALQRRRQASPRLAPVFLGHRAVRRFNDERQFARWSATGL